MGLKTVNYKMDDVKLTPLLISTGWLQSVGLIGTTFLSCFAFFVDIVLFIKVGMGTKPLQIITYAQHQYVNHTAAEILAIDGGVHSDHGYLEIW